MKSLNMRLIIFSILFFYPTSILCSSESECENCQKCTKINGTSTCSLCKSGYFQYLEKGTFSCQECPSNCSTCKNKSKCISCSNGYSISAEETCYEGKSSKSNIGLIIGLVIGIPIILIVFFYLIFCCIRKRREQNKRNKRQKSPKTKEQIAREANLHKSSNYQHQTTKIEAVPQTNRPDSTRGDQQGLQSQRSLLTSQRENRHAGYTQGRAPVQSDHQSLQSSRTLAQEDMPIGRTSRTNLNAQPQNFNYPARVQSQVDQNTEIRPYVPPIVQINIDRGKKLSLSNSKVNI